MHFPHSLAALTLLSVLSTAAWAAPAAPQNKPVASPQDTVALEGVLVSEGARKGKRPGVVLFTDWMGVTESAKTQTEKVAKMG